MWLLLAAAWAAEVEVAPASPDMRVDGVLDEPAWARATPVTTFERFQPTPGGAPAEQIEVRFVQDEDTLYVGVHVWGTAAPVRARVSPREDIDSDDQVGLYLDPFHDARSGYIFYFNALGIQQDIRFDNGSWDVRWSTVMRSRGVVDPDHRGFTLEIALPFRSLKYPRAQTAQTWGVMLTRKVPSEGAKYGFPTLQRGHPRMFLQAADLRGVRPTLQGSGVELIPALTTRVESTREAPDAPLAWSDLDPWFDVIRPSLDLRAGVGTNMGVVAAVNPDFSQVESDVAPVVLNRRFAFAFPEQRPFFTEGANHLQDDANTLYTRSVVEPLYGLKIGGREGEWSVGALHALDLSPGASVNERGAPGFSPEEVADRWAMNTMLRVRRDLPGAGQIGMTVADKRLVPMGLRYEGQGAPDRGAADNLGIDLTVPVGRRWTLLSRHDQSIVTAGGEQEGGTNTAARLVRASGERLGLDLSTSFASAGYRQEMGFRTQSGVFQAAATADWTAPFDGVVSTWTPSASVTFYEEVGGEHYREAGTSQALLLDGVHTLTLDVAWSHRRERQPEARGDVHGWFAGLGYEGQIGGAVELSAYGAADREMDFYDLQPTLRAQLQVETALRPATPLRIDLLARWVHFDREAPRADGVDVSDDLLLRGRVQWQLTRQWGVRLIAAYNQIDNDQVGGDQPGAAYAPTLESSALVTWLLHPFTAVYVGFAERDQLGPEARTLERSVFAKATVWWRP